MYSARAFLLRIFSTAKSWLKWVLVNLESTVSRTCVHFCAGATILRFGRAVVFFGGAMFLPSRDVVYIRSVCHPIEMRQPNAIKGVLVKEMLRVVVDSLHGEAGIHAE
jgi:hypothetical protein